MRNCGMNTIHSTKSLARVWGICALLVCAVLLSVGCTTHHPVDLSYANRAFSVTVRGSVCRTATDGYKGNPALPGEGFTNHPREVSATVTVGAPSSDGSSRPLAVTFTAPDALAGLTVTRRADAQGRPITILAWHGQTVTDTTAAFDGLLLLAYACLPVGDVTAVSPATASGYTVTLAGGGAEQILTFPVEAVQGAAPCHIRYTHASGWVELQVMGGQ